MGEEVPLQELHGSWTALLRGGQVMTALILSTSYSEKYKGRHLKPGAVAELRLPSEGDQPVNTRPSLLHRSGNKEAVAFTWLGDESAGDRSIYVAFSPLRHRIQFLKICCAGMVEDGISNIDRSQSKFAAWKAPAEAFHRKVPISAYVHHKLQKLWGAQGLWQSLSSCVEEFPSHRVIFAGISHGGALAQAAALQFCLRKRHQQVYIVTWNAYRWTNDIGKAAVEEELADRILPFVLSRRKEEPHATRYWDSVTGFPPTYAPMPNCVLLDADTGDMFRHTAPQKGSNIGALFLMRMFELHFAKAALIAMKKATVASHGGNRAADMDSGCSINPLAEAFQDKVLHTTDHIAQAGKRLNRATTKELAEVRAEVRRRLTTAKESLREESMRIRNSHPIARMMRPAAARELQLPRDAVAKSAKDAEARERRRRLARLAWCCGC